MTRVLHVTTVDMTLRFLLAGQFRRLCDAGYEVTAMSASGRWAADLGVRHIPWRAATRRADPASDVRALRELVRVLRRERFDVLHTHNPKPGVLGRVAGKVTRTPVVHTTHGFWATPTDPAPKRAAVYGIEWLASRLSAFELYQSREDLELAKRLRIARPGRSAWLGNGVDLERFSPRSPDASTRQQWGIDDGAPVIGMVGRLVAEKGWREYAQAARMVRRTHPDAVFVSIGPEDPDKPDALDRRLLDGTTICGMILDMPAALSVLDVFVLASYREGVPRASIEAAAMGKPLVLTDIRGCREVISDGVEGVLVPPRDADALASAITKLLDDPHQRERMGNAARDRAVREFDERDVVRRTIAAYEAVLR